MHDSTGRPVDLADRHPGVRDLARHLTPNPNLPEPLRRIAERVEGLAADLIDDIPDGPELTAGLRKLLEAKDCLVRAALDADR